MNYPYTIVGNSASVFFEGAMHIVESTDNRFECMCELLRMPKHDKDKLESILEMPKAIERVTQGLVTVTEDNVTYVGEVVQSTMARRLIEMLQQGHDVKPWAAFMNNLMLNPSYRSRECLFDFLENCKTPITEDGCFIAFKMVKDNYKDSHTGTMDNSVGKVVSMARSQVDDDPNNTCSAGLHVCGSRYMNGYTFGPRTMVCKVNPRDVVAVPRDYSFAKMRLCRYEVIAEIERDNISKIESQQVYRGVEA